MQTHRDSWELARPPTTSIQETCRPAKRVQLSPATYLLQHCRDYHPLRLFPSSQRKEEANYQHITSTGTQSPCQKNQNTPELGAALRAGVCPSQHLCGSPSMLQAAHGQFQQQIYILCKPLQGTSVDTWGFLYMFFAIIIFLVKTSSSCAPQQGVWRAVAGAG